MIEANLKCDRCENTHIVVQAKERKSSFSGSLFGNYKYQSPDAVTINGRNLKEMFPDDGDYFSKLEEEDESLFLCPNCRKWIEKENKKIILEANEKIRNCFYAKVTKLYPD